MCRGAALRPRTADKGIVLVLVDFKSAQKLGYVHSYPTDVNAYRNLINAGATVVFDARMVAVAEEPAMEETRPLLDGMLAVNADGRLMRDVWLSSNLLANAKGRYNLRRQTFMSLRTARR